MSSPVMKVKNFFDVPAKKRTYPMLASQKHDGQFAYLRQGVGYSRTGKEYASLLPLARLAQSLRPNQVFLIEFMVDDEDRQPLPVNEISGFFRRDKECPRAYGIVHDMIPVSAFDAGEFPIPFRLRERFLQNVLDTSNQDYLYYNEQTEVNNEEEAVAFAKKFIDLDLEGACFKDPEGIWVAGKKDYRQMKIKGEVSYDLEVTDLEEGATGTKNEGKFGKLVCRWKDGRFVKTRGCITDQQGAEWWANPSLIIGQIVKVDGMCLTPDGMIREPRFKEVRHDKEKADV